MPKVYKELSDAIDWCSELLTHYGFPIHYGPEKNGGGRHSDKTKKEVEDLVLKCGNLQSQNDELLKLNKSLEAEILNKTNKKKGGK